VVADPDTAAELTDPQRARFAGGFHEKHSTELGQTLFDIALSPGII
jgi:hypothetical protein